MATIVRYPFYLNSADQKPELIAKAPRPTRKLQRVGGTSVVKFEAEALSRWV